MVENNTISPFNFASCQNVPQEIAQGSNKIEGKGYIHGGAVRLSVNIPEKKLKQCFLDILFQNKELLKIIWL